MDRQKDLTNDIYGNGYDDGKKVGKTEVINGLMKSFLEFKASSDVVSCSTLIKILEALKAEIESEKSDETYESIKRNAQYISLVNSSDYQNRVLKCITSDELDKYFNCTVFSDKPECRQAMIHGMAIAAMLISDCTIVGITKSISKEE